MRPEIRYVYKLVNSENGRIYVGMTSMPEQRIKMHMQKLRLKKHPCALMQEDYDKFGEDAFSMEIIEEFVWEGAQRITPEREWMIRLKTYDERFGYNCNDWMMNPVRKANGLSYKVSNRKGCKLKEVV